MIHVLLRFNGGFRLRMYRFSLYSLSAVFVSLQNGNIWKYGSAWYNMVGQSEPNMLNQICWSWTKYGATSNKELQIINQMQKTCIAAQAGYAQNTLETVTKLNHVFKYFHSVMKQIQRLENMKKNDTFSDGNLH